MEIDLQTKIGVLLQAYPTLEETLIQLSPAFAKLRNPLLRRTVARVTTIHQAAKIAGIAPNQLLQQLRHAAGLTPLTPAEAVDDEQEEVEPEWFDATKITIRFDVSPIIEAGESPLTEIMHLADRLERETILALTLPFRPEPIMDRLRSKGFSVWYKSHRCFVLKPGTVQ